MVLFQAKDFCAYARPAPACAGLLAAARLIKLEGGSGRVPSGSRYRLHHHQHQFGRVLFVVINRLGGFDGVGFGGDGGSRIGIAIEAGEIAAGDFQTDAMALLEDVAGTPASTVMR
jgi:hypothetical protein